MCLFVNPNSFFFSFQKQLSQQSTLTVRIGFLSCICLRIHRCMFFYQYGKEISNKCNYFGIDYSRSLINKAIKLTKCKVYNCEANNLPFKDNYFDKAAPSLKRQNGDLLQITSCRRPRTLRTNLKSRATRKPKQATRGALVWLWLDRP